MFLCITFFSKYLYLYDLMFVFLYTYQSHYFEVCNYYNIWYLIYTINMVNDYISMLKTMDVIMTYCIIPLLKNIYVVSNPLLLFALALMKPFVYLWISSTLPRSEIQGQRAYKLLYILKHVSKLSSRLVLLFRLPLKTCKYCFLTATTTVFIKAKKLNG